MVMTQILTSTKIKKITLGRQRKEDRSTMWAISPTSRATPLNLNQDTLRARHPAAPDQAKARSQAPTHLCTVTSSTLG